MARIKMDILQILGSFIAILLLTGLVYFLFPQKHMFTEDTVRKEAKRYEPELAFTQLILSRNIPTAILLTKEPADTALIVTGLGDGLVCRKLERGANIKWAVTGEKLRLDMHDFTCPAIIFDLKSADIETATQAFEALATYSDKEANHAT